MLYVFLWSCFLCSVSLLRLISRPQRSASPPLASALFFYSSPVFLHLQLIPSFVYFLFKSVLHPSVVFPWSCRSVTLFPWLIVNPAFGCSLGVVVCSSRLLSAAFRTGGGSIGWSMLEKRNGNRKGKPLQTGALGDTEARPQSSFALVIDVCLFIWAIFHVEFMWKSS